MADSPSQAPRRAARGWFITVEGVDGVGKSTQLDGLAAHLVARGERLRRSFEPGGTPLGAALREWLLAHRAEAAPAARAEALLFLADRAQHVEQVVRPALAAGETVLCSRFTHSTLAYQCFGLGLDRAAVEAADGFARGGLWPDLVLLLDAPRETVTARLGARAAADDRIEARAARFWESVRQGFLTLAAEDPERVAVIDAAPSPEAVQAALRARVDALLARPRPLLDEASR